MKLKNSIFLTLWWIGRNLGVQPKLTFKNLNIPSLSRIWKNLTNPNEATLTNSNYQSFCELQKLPPRGVLCKKVFLEIWQNSQENTCARVSFLINFHAFGNFFFTEHLWTTTLRISKSLKYNVRPTFKYPNVISNGWIKKMLCLNLSFTVENEGNLNEIKVIHISNSIQYKEWNIRFSWILSIYQWKWIGKNVKLTH